MVIITSPRPALGSSGLLMIGDSTLVGGKSLCLGFFELMGEDVKTEELAGLEVTEAEAAAGPMGSLSEIGVNLTVPFVAFELIEPEPLKLLLVFSEDWGESATTCAFSITNRCSTKKDVSNRSLQIISCTFSFFLLSFTCKNY